MGVEHRLRRCRWVGRVAALALVGTSMMPLVARAEEDDAPSAQRFAVVLEGVLHGDLVMAANSNLRSAGGWDMTTSSVADVDDERSVLCVGRGDFDAVCADNSSSARLAIPRGARVVHARLYVETSLSASADALRVRLAGPKARDYTVLGTDTVNAPKLYEASARVSTNAVLRQAVWDVTKRVAANGPGTYTVADIVSERAGPFLPYAAWAIVAAYELDTAVDVDALAAEDQQQFARRAVSWHDGFVVPSKGTNDVPVAGFTVGPGSAVFAKSFHVVARARRGEADNLLFNGRPLGNNLTPGDNLPPPVVMIGANRSCNSTTDVFNETICELGSPVAAKKPGRTGYVTSSDGTTRSSGSAVDIDVIRIPDRYLVADSTTAMLSVSAGDNPPALGVFALSLDLAAAPS